MYNNPDKIYTNEMPSILFEVKNNSVKLTWSTSSELNSKGFDIERSTGVNENPDWKKLAK
ncbi:MAG: hypothetical protein IPL53_12955 [Ignavibacteria bacterium]|nr:hypothetical protein [Ignavibacteria bacterium]